jgi:hypothetical protein
VDWSWLNGAVGAAVGAAAGLGAAGGNPLLQTHSQPHLKAHPVRGHRGLAGQGPAHIPAAPPATAPGADPVGKLVRDFDEEAPWLWQGIKDLLDIFS